LDSNGNILLEPEAEVVMPGNITSLDLSGHGLDFPADANQAGVRAVVRLLNPQARGIATLEIENTVTNSRFVLFDPGVDAVIARPQMQACSGPTTMRAIDSARLTVANEGRPGDPRDALFDVKLQIVDGHFQPLAEKIATVDFNHTASVDLPNYVGTILGLATFFAQKGYARATVTLELFDRALGPHTAFVVGGTCRGYADGGGNGGGGNDGSGGP
jgi:hypothetical protein